MRQLLFMGAIAAAALFLMPDRSQAQGLGFGYGYGQRTAPYGFLGRLATHHMQWIHQDGPLYNYGPYYTPGHVTMHIPKPYHGAYVPADYTLWNNGYGHYGYGYGYGAGYPAQAQAYPQTAPPAAAPVAAPAAPPARITATAPPVGDVIPAAVLPTAKPRVLASPYHAIYPSWLTNR